MLADDPLEGKGEVVDPPSRDSVEYHIMYGEQLAHIGQMLLVAAEPVHILDDQNLRLAGFESGKRGLESRALHRGASDAIVAVKSDELHAMLTGIGLRKHLLVIDRGGAMVRIVEALAAIANGELGHRCSPPPST